MSEHNFLSMRRAMVESQLRTTDVSDPAVIAAMASVSRENFVPKDLAALAYTDRAVSLGGGRSLNPPLATGLLLTVAEVSKDDHVLLIGSATGYAAALLAELVGSVVAVEESQELHKQALNNVTELDNVILVEGALSDGYSKAGPYSLIIIDGAVEQLPDSCVDQLGDEGRLVTAVMDDGVSRLAIGRKAAGAFGLSYFADSDAVVLPGFEKAKAFSF